MPDVTAPPSFKIFAGALSTGLLWGIGVATFITTAWTTFVLADQGFPPVAPTIIFETFVYMATAATVLAFFPIGPVAGVLGWLLYRRGIVARWAHAAVGAVSALAAPILILLWLTDTARCTSTTNLAVVREGPAMASLAAFPIIGAFAGFMAAGVLQRSR